MSRSIKIVDLYEMFGTDSFELFVKSRKVVGGFVRLEVLIGKDSFDIWEPKNRVWIDFDVKDGMGLICRICEYGEMRYIEPLKQLIVLREGESPLDLFELPYEDGEVIKLGVGIVTSRNKTQYMIVMNKRYGSSLIRVPANWEKDLDSLQYRAIKVRYKRTMCKGFLSIISRDGSLNTEQISRLFKY